MQEHVAMSNDKPVEHGLTACWGHLQTHFSESQILPWSLHKLYSFSSLHSHLHFSRLNSCLGPHISFWASTRQPQRHDVSSSTSKVEQNFSQRPGPKPQEERITGTFLMETLAETQLWKLLWHPPPHFMTDMKRGVICVKLPLPGISNFTTLSIGWQWKLLLSAATIWE